MSRASDEWFAELVAADPPDMPAWLRDAGSDPRDDPDAVLRAMCGAPANELPAWLRPAGTGGHQASAGEKQHAWARFAGARSAHAPAATAGRAGVFASMRRPGEVSDLARHVFGIRP